jgi:two-component system cell cycle response regulator DivK
MFFWRIRPSQKPNAKPAFESFLRQGAGPAPTAMAHYPAPTAVAHSPKIADHRPVESPQPSPRPMSKTILIVEDNELNMKLFHDLLDAHGYKTLQTRNGKDALALAREHRPDLILMDIQLPEVSGLEVTKWLKEDDQLKKIPVVAVTAFAMKGDEERIREGGCEAYISKPISVAMFLDTVRRFVGEAR